MPDDEIPDDEMPDDEFPSTEPSDTDIAIVGMAGRFPGAPDVDALWRRVVAGDDCLVDLSRDELVAAGVPEHVLNDPDYVRRAGVLDDVEAFDPGFFGIGQRDAAIMDPQHRHFIECCWEALETSGHVPERFDGAIGVFGGCGFNTYMLNNLLTNPTLVEQVGMFLLRHTANDKDFLTTTVSYKLDLHGPSVNVQTACSTSLVAVHLAVQSLLAFECDLALAGGATIHAPHGVGYTYQEGEVLSPDGVCRAFDELSAGTVITNGAGVVALRRLADAMESRDPILAVIKGSAINNDGQRKVGYLAPSVDGHADVVKEALAVAGLSARDIQLLEAHGTGTSVGDPIEVAALTEAFRVSTADTGYCRLTSTKPNIGHLDTAAGVASLIKVVQAMRHGTLPPLANHTAASPLLDLERSPFVISSEASVWPDHGPRRAGVSSLGVGGTNAHVIVEEAPPAQATPAARPEQILTLSARDTAALDDATNRLADFLEASPETNLADVAHTLAVGRRALARRKVIVASDTAGAVAALRSGDRNRVASSAAPDEAQRVAFMFPGGGAQYTGMAGGLDDRFEVFHQVMADGIEGVRQRSGIDLGPLLRADAPADALRQTTTSLPAVFLTSVALARQWQAWGVTPSTFVGHSLGEYAAAHLAGVLTLDGALDLIIARATLIDQVSGAGAAMLAIPLSEAEVRPLLPSSLSIATINADDECVIAGPTEDIEMLAKRVATDEVKPTIIPIAAAGHSSMLDPILPAFLEAAEQVEMSPPQIPYPSNLTGTWITPEQATDPTYWVDHLRHTVRFSDCLQTVLADGPLVLMELGPGHSLSSYARRQTIKPTAAIPALRHPQQDVDDTVYSLLAFARGWSAGVDLDLAGFAGTDRRRLRLPGYPFRKERHWIEPGERTYADATTRPAPAVSAPPQPAMPERIADVADWFWAREWTDRPPTPPALAPVGPWLVIGSPDDELVAELANTLAARGESVEITASPTSPQLVAARSVLLVGPTGSFEAAIDRWLTVGSAAVRALGEVDGAPTLLAAITRGATDAGGAATAPADAMALGIVGTGPREYVDVRTTWIDLAATRDAASAAPSPPSPAVEAAAVIGELFGGSDLVVAHREHRRMVPTSERIRVAAPPPDAVTFRRGGSYLVTGGLGGIGFAVATHLARDHAANLVVIANGQVPGVDERSAWLDRHGYDDPTSRRIRRLAELESHGTKVAVVTADLAAPDSIVAALDEAESFLGHLDGAVHAAGELRDRPIELATSDDHEAVVGAKARGALTLTDELAHRGADLLVLVSSTSTILVPDGQAAYVAANSVLDALAGAHTDLDVRTINYGVWGELGIAAAAARQARLGIEPGEPVAHPVLSEMSVDRDGATHLVGTLTTDHHWVVDEHRSSAGTALLPGTGHLELLLAGSQLIGAGATAIGPVTLLDPLVVPDERPVTVRVSIAAADDQGGRWARIESDGGAGTWRVHSEAQLVPDPGDRPATRTVPSRTDDLAPLDVLARPASQVRFGPRWDALGDAWADGDGIAGRLSLPERYHVELDAWRAHPALVDVATAFGVWLGSHDDRLYVPVGYDGVSRYGALPPTPWVTARRNASSSDDLLRVDIELGDDRGDVVLRIDGLALRPITDPGALADPAALDVPTTTGPATGDSGRRIPPLVAIAGELGIRATEGIDLLERLLAGDHRRLVASSIDLDDLAELATPFASPAAETTAATAPAQNTVLSAIRTMWVDLLGISDLDDEDDFFELGGHSLIAIRLMSRIHKELGVRLQLTTIFDAATITGLTAKVLDARPDLDDVLAAATATSPTAAASSVAPSVAAGPTAPEAHRSLVPINTTGDGSPIFIVHGAGGNVLFLWSLARAMAGNRPVYGFQAHGVNGDDMPDPTIEAMAERYVAELRAAHRGPYILGGYSGGGVVAFEMVRQLIDLGEEVDYLVLFDSPPAGMAKQSRIRELRHFSRNIRTHGLGPLMPYVRWRARRAVLRVLPRTLSRTEELDASARQIGATGVEESGFVNLYYYFSAAAERYQMGQVDVDAAIIKADWIWPVYPHDYHWGRFVTGHLDIAEAPGDHWAMFFPENAPRLAEVVMSLLDRRAR